MKKHLLAALTLTSLVVLLAIELFTHYDTPQRQIALAITNLAGVGIFFWLRARLRSKAVVLPWTVLTFVAVAIWLDALGNFQHLYARFWWWDRATHVVGLLPITVGVFLVLERLNAAGRIQLPPWARALFAVTLANSFGVAYEISEWLGDIWFHTERIRGPFDTPHDLLNNLVGSLLVIVGAVIVKRLTGTKPSASIPA